MDMWEDILSQLTKLSKNNSFTLLNNIVMQLVR